MDFYNINDIVNYYTIDSVYSKILELLYANDEFNSSKFILRSADTQGMMHCSYDALSYALN